MAEVVIIAIAGAVAYVACAGLAYRIVGGWARYYEDEWKYLAIVLWPIALAIVTAWYVVGVPLRATFRLTSRTITK